MHDAVATTQQDLGFKGIVHFWRHVSRDPKEATFDSLTENVSAQLKNLEAQCADA